MGKSTHGEALEPPPFDPRPSIRLHNGMPEHPKVVGLSDAAFRLYIEALCWCSRQEVDGVIPEAQMKRMGKPRTITELTRAGDPPLVIHMPGEYVIHDYLRHQRSGDEIDSYRSARSLDGKHGAHNRWHIPRRVKVKDCMFCYPPDDSPPLGGYADPMGYPIPEPYVGEGGYPNG